MCVYGLDSRCYFGIVTPFNNFFTQCLFWQIQCWITFYFYTLYVCYDWVDTIWDLKLSFLSWKFFIFKFIDYKFYLFKIYFCIFLNEKLLIVFLYLCFASIYFQLIIWLIHSIFLWHTWLFSRMLSILIMKNLIFAKTTITNISNKIL